MTPETIKTQLALATTEDASNFSIKEVEHDGHPLFLISSRHVAIGSPELAAKIVVLLAGYTADDNNSGRLFTHADQKVT